MRTSRRWMTKPDARNPPRPSPREDCRSKSDIDVVIGALATPSRGRPGHPADPDQYAQIGISERQLP